MFFKSKPRDGARKERRKYLKIVWKALESLESKLLYSGVLDLILSAPSRQEVDLAWGAVAAASRYDVYRASDANFTQNVQPLGSVTSRTFADMGAPVGTSYYRVQAFTSGNSLLGNGNVAQTTVNLTPTLPSGATLQGFATDALSPLMTDPSVLAPFLIQDGHQGNGLYTSYANRFALSPSQTSSTVTINGDGSPTITQRSDGLGNYSITTSGQTIDAINMQVPGDGTWTYKETVTQAYSVDESFTGFDGSSWHLTQSGTDTYTFNATGNGALYVFSSLEARSDAWDIHTSTGAGAFLHTGSASGTQVMSMSDSGNIQASGGSGPSAYIRQESSNYQAVGTNISSDDNGRIVSSGVSSRTINNAQSDWTYTVTGTDYAFAATPLGPATTGPVYSQSLVITTNGSRNFQTLGQENSDTTASGLITTETIVSNQSALSGTETSSLSVTGTTASSPAGSSSHLVSNYQDAVIDNMSSSATKVVLITDQSQPYVTITARQASNATTTSRHREFRQATKGDTTLANGAVTAFTGSATGSNTMTTLWVAGDDNQSSGTDNSVAGILRSFTSHHQLQSNGEGDFAFNSYGSEVINGATVTKTGLSTTDDREAENSQWNNADSSAVNSDTFSYGSDGETETTVGGTDSTTDIGCGSSLDINHGVALYNNDQTVHTAGSASHLATTLGATTEDHNYTTGVTVTDTNTPYVTTTTHSVAVAQSHSPGTYEADSHGTLASLDGATNQTLVDHRHDTGTQTTHNTEDDDKTVDDSKTWGVITNSYAEVHSIKDSSGNTTQDDVTTTVTVNGLAVSSVEISSFNSSGTTSGSVNSNSQSDIQDLTTFGVVVESDSTSTSQDGSNGTYTDQGGGTVTINAAQQTQTLKWHQYVDQGGHTSGNHATLSNSTDDVSEYDVEKTQQTDSTTDSDGGGTYLNTITENSLSDFNGSYTSSSIVASSTTTTGDSSVWTQTVSTELGTQYPAQYVSVDVDSTVTSTEQDDSSFAANDNVSTDTETSGGTTNIISNEHHDRQDTGTTLSDTAIDSTSTTYDNSVLNVYTTQTNTTNSDDSRSGEFLTTYTFDGQTVNGITISAETLVDHRDGTMDWINSTTTSSYSDDTSQAGTEKTATSDSSNDETGSGNWSSSDYTQTIVYADGSTSSQEDSDSGNEASGTTDSTFHLHAETHESLDTVSGGNYWEEVISVADSNSDDDKSSSGTFTNIVTDEFHTLNGVTSSRNYTEQDSAGTSTEDTSTDSHGTSEDAKYDWSYFDEPAIDQTSGNDSREASHSGSTYDATTTHLSIVGADGSSSTDDTNHYEANGTFSGNNSSNSWTDIMDWSTINAITHQHQTNDSYGTTSGGVLYDFLDSENNVTNGVATGSYLKIHNDSSNYTSGTLVATYYDQAQTDDNHASDPRAVLSVISNSTNSDSSAGVAINEHQDGWTNDGVNTWSGSDDYTSDIGTTTYHNHSTTDVTSHDFSQSHVTSSSHTQSSSLQDGSGHYSNWTDATVDNGQTWNSDFSHTDSHGTYSSNDAAHTTRDEDSTNSTGGRRQVSTTRDETHIVSGGQDSSYHDVGHNNPGYISLDEQASTQSANVLVTLITDSNATEVFNLNDQFQTTKTNTTFSDVTQNDGGSYLTSSGTSNVIDEEGYASNASFDERDEAGSSDYFTETDNTSHAVGTSAAGSTTVTADSYDDETDQGTGSYEQYHSWTTVAGFTWGNSFDSVDGSGESTWDKDTYSQKAFTEPSATGTHTQVNSEDNSDSGSKDYSTDASNSKTIDTTGAVSYDGSSVHDETSYDTKQSIKSSGSTESTLDTTNPAYRIDHSDWNSAGGGTTTYTVTQVETTTAIDPVMGYVLPANTITTASAQDFATIVNSYGWSTTITDTTTPGITRITIDTYADVHTTEGNKVMTPDGQVGNYVQETRNETDEQHWHHQDSTTGNGTTYSHTSDLDEKVLDHRVANMHELVASTGYDPVTWLASNFVTPISFDASRTYTYKWDEYYNTNYGNGSYSSHSENHTLNINQRTETRNSGSGTGTVNDSENDSSWSDWSTNSNNLQGSASHQHHHDSYNYTRTQAALLNADGTTTLTSSNIQTHSTYEDDGWNSNTYTYSYTYGQWVWVNNGYGDCCMNGQGYGDSCASGTGYGDCCVNCSCGDGSCGCDCGQGYGDCCAGYGEWVYEESTAYATRTDFSSWGDSGWWDQTENLSGTTVAVNESWFDSGSGGGSNSWTYQMNLTDALWPELLGSDWYEDARTMVANINDSFNGFATDINALWQDVKSFVINPGAYIQDTLTDNWQAIQETYEKVIDTTTGFVDGFTQAINPLDNWFHIPDIGPVYGHTELYGYGKIAGMVTGAATQIVIGAVATGGVGGLAGCGSLLAEGAALYTDVSTVAGVVQASEHVIEGKAGWGDALAFLPVVTWGAGKMAGIGGCFVKGTQVAIAREEMADDEMLSAGDSWQEEGSTALALAAPARVGYRTQAIETLQEGDILLSRPEGYPEGVLVRRKIEKAFSRQVFALTFVTIQSSSGAVQTITTTNEHPVFVEDRGWLMCRELRQGDQLHEPDGGRAVVSAIRHEAYPDGVAVYNFRVDGSHTYFVREEGSTAEPIWVHNSCEGEARVAESMLEEAGLSERSASEIGLAERHHLVTRYPNAGPDAASAREILANASVDLEDEANLFDLGGHFGKHPAEYHEAVLGLLKESIAGLEVGSNSYNAAVRSTLLDIKNVLSNPDNWLTRLITH